MGGTKCFEHEELLGAVPDGPFAASLVGAANNVETRQDSPRLSGDELRDLLGLIEGADTVELKLTVAESDRKSALSALDVDPLEARVRQVFFFDTPDLDLYEHGVVARARRTQTKPEKS